MFKLEENAWSWNGKLVDSFSISQNTLDEIGQYIYKLENEIKTLKPLAAEFIRVGENDATTNN